MTSIDLDQALRDYPASLVGWWTSADGSGQLDMTGLTVEQAIAELLEMVCSNDEDRAAIMAGTIEVAI
jgi:hypothetical protein